MVTKIFNYICPECNQKMCSISVTPEKMECSKCNTLCDFVGSEEDRQAIKPDFEHIDFKSNTKPECAISGKKCGILNYKDNVCVIELEPYAFHDITSDTNKVMRKYSVRPCGEKDAVPILFEEVIE